LGRTSKGAFCSPIFAVCIAIDLINWTMACLCANQNRSIVDVHIAAKGLKHEHWTFMNIQESEQCQRMDPEYPDESKNGLLSGAKVALHTMAVMQSSSQIVTEVVQKIPGSKPQGPNRPKVHHVNSIR
jgi:hypothetical protein